MYVEDKDILVSANDGIVSVWDCRNNYKLIKSFKHHTGAIYALDYISSLDVIASGGED